MSAVLSATESEIEIADRVVVDSLATGLSFMLLANLIQRGIGFVRNIWVCRMLSDDELGLWALASSFFVLAAPLAVLGLPGTFGRMSESYRMAGLLNLYLRHVVLASALGVVFCVSWIVIMPGISSSAVFGTAMPWSTMLLLSATLLVVIVFNGMTELLGGLRQPRVVSAMHTCNSLAFTFFGLLGLYFASDWRVLMAAFAISAFVGLLPSISVLRRWSDFSKDRVDRVELEPFSVRRMWLRILPFALSIWCLNLLMNSFDLVDRYMLLFFASESPEHGRALVGQFHSGRIMPVLLSSLSLMLSGMLLPYLATEWERGKVVAVQNSLRLTLKCSNVFFVVFSVAAMAIAPLLFEHLLDGRYSDGLSIMPLALMHCCFSASAFLMQNYFWCAERGKTVGLTIGGGLLLNICLNALLVPRWGIHGAMCATTISGAAILAVTLLELRRSGIHLGASSVCFSILPVALIVGTLPAAAILAAYLIVTSRSDRLFDRNEKQIIDEVLVPRLQRIGFKITSVWPTFPR